LRSAARVWTEVGLKSFGGPAGQIAVMHRILVEERGWISERRFMHALNFCMVLPGPEAMQLATYVGWLLNGTVGGLVAGALFVLPGFVSILCLSIAYAFYADVAVVTALFFGLKAAVVAIVADALARIARRALRNAWLVAIAAASFTAMFFLHVPFPLVIALAAAAGWLGARLNRNAFVPPLDPEDPLPEPGTSSGIGPRALATALKLLVTWSLIWFVPLILLAFLLGPQHTIVTQGVFFSQVAMLTFGGAYAVLAYVAQEAVQVHGWLRPGEMLDGLGMAETTPGPLIQVVQFVGFMGAYRQPGGLDPLTAAVLASLVVTWVTFVPCFLWIFLGGPYIERLRGRPGIEGPFSGITAAVVGVILNLAIWFALHFLFGRVEEETFGGFIHLSVPIGATIDYLALGLTLLGIVLVFRYRAGIFTTLLACTGVGFVARLLAT
jgi:chromate transporter